jgi:protein-arginine kinase
VDELFLLSQPAHLQLRVTDKLDAEQRDALRADMLRERLRAVQPPDASKLGAKAE